ncbi:hypothetical protein QBC47DRAFT_396008 [Echria macrotheca]|uniref:Uncharacterized protein n=1 Tax=Echria macrotheca TaxID=438768 RepID=A0AAJ0B0A3_9PEZI|nr:hypothetical protein QBC47DRAFT_396008 [Echria macrotheca]
MTESSSEKQNHPTHHPPSPSSTHKLSSSVSYRESVKRVIMILSVLTLATLALSSLALPAPVVPAPSGVRKVSTIPAFNVTGFTASAVVLSHRVYYRFNVTFCPELPHIECFALGTTLSESLSSTPLTKCGRSPIDSSADPEGNTKDPSAPPDPDVAFQWTRHDQTAASGGDGGESSVASLLIVRTLDDGVIDQAQYLVPSNHTENVGEGRFRHEVYGGPEDFSIPAFRYEVA